MTAPEEPTVALLDRWNSGDAAALPALVELHLPWLRGHLSARVGEFLRRRGDIDDYLQDAMLDFLRDAPRFRIANETQFRGLLARVVENTLRDRNDWFRARRRDLGREQHGLSESVLSLQPAMQQSSTPSRQVMRDEAKDWVRLGLELLEPEDRRILIAREYDNRSFVEIGTELGMSANAVRMRWVRAVARLADLLRELRAGRLPGDAPAS